MSHPPSCPQGSWPRPTFEVADVFKIKGESYNSSHVLTPEQGRLLRDISACRTATLGGHEDVCDTCGFTRPAYNSCRNRHCPKCQGAAQFEWVEKHMGRVLPTHYFHVVATLPAELRPLVHRNRRALFRLLFQTTTRTLLALGEDRLGARLGITAVLHTWTRELLFHPHLHCIVTGGGLALDESSWVRAKQNYLFPYLVLSRLFRGKFLAGLARLYEQGQLDLGGECEPLADKDVFAQLKDRLYRKDWVVYQKPPFGGPEDVYRYLGRYTHRVAISNWRIEDIDDSRIRFKTRHEQTATLTHDEFIRRFLLHVLPKGFVKIRHYGLLAPAHAGAKLDKAQRLLGSPVEPDPPEPPGQASTGPSDERLPDSVVVTPDTLRCPLCGVGRLLHLPLSKPQSRGRSP